MRSAGAENTTAFAFEGIKLRNVLEGSGRRAARPGKPRSCQQRDRPPSQVAGTAHPAATRSQMQGQPSLTRAVTVTVRRCHGARCVLLWRPRQCRVERLRQHQIAARSGWGRWHSTARGTKRKESAERSNVSWGGRSGRPRGRGAGPAATTTQAGGNALAATPQHAQNVPRHVYIIQKKLERTRGRAPPWHLLPGRRQPQRLRPLRLAPQRPQQTARIPSHLHPHILLDDAAWLARARGEVKQRTPGTSCVFLSSPSSRHELV